MGKRNAAPLNGVGRLHQALTDAGIPIDGVRQRGGVFEVDFQANATPAQRQQAATILASFDPKALSPSESLWQQARSNMNPVTFAGLPTPQKLDAIRAALELLLAE